MEPMEELVMGQVAEMEQGTGQARVQRILVQKFYRSATRVLKMNSTKMRRWQWILWLMKEVGFYRQLFNRVVRLPQTGSLLTLPREERLN